MTGIDKNFVEKYIQFKTNKGNNISDDNTLSQKELNILKEMAQSGNIDTESAKKLKDLIINNRNDFTINEDDRKLLLTLGSSVDNRGKLNNFISALGSDKTKTSNHKISEQDPTNSTIADLLEKGFTEKLSSETRYREENSVLSALRDAYAEPINFVADVLFMTQGVKKPEVFDVNTTEEASESYLQKGISMLQDFLLSSAEKNSCISSALKEISSKAGFSVKDMPERKLSQKFLKEATGKDWDGINIAEQNKKGNLEKLLTPNKDKALIVVGTHTFVFKGFKDGKLQVTDPSDNNKIRLINKDNPAAVVYVLGKGDGTINDKDGTNAVLDKKSIIKTFDKIDSIKTLNSTDRDDKTGESWNIRKVLSGMANIKFLDKISSFADEFNKVKDNPDKGNIIVNSLKKFLTNEMKVELDSQEIKAMIERLTSKIGNDKEQTTVLDEIRKNVSSGNSEQKSNYSFGIQYSDVNLKDYFTNTSPTDMLRVLKEMIEGKEGC